jgi:cytidine deaminase
VRFVFGSSDKPRGLDYLLPERFRPSDLLGPASGQPLLLQPQHHGLSLTKASLEKAAARARADADGGALFRAAAAAALAAARASYAPYTRCASGAAIITDAGEVYGGGYIESNAYNPSLAPFQAAVVAAVKAGGLPGYASIAEVVLVELGGTKVRQSANTKQLLKAVAGGRRPAPLTRLAAAAGGGADDAAALC